MAKNPIYIIMSSGVVENVIGLGLSERPVVVVEEPTSSQSQFSSYRPEPASDYDDITNMGSSTLIQMLAAADELLEEASS